MTVKELREVREGFYRDRAQECLASEDPCGSIVGVCHAIALEPCYGHHERGQRLWAFFRALKDEGAFDYGAVSNRPSDFDNETSGS